MNEDTSERKDIIIAYYRNKSGKISSCHEIKEMSLEEIERSVEEFNGSEHGVKTTVHIVTIKPDSFEEYLYSRYKEKIRERKEELRTLRDNLYESIQLLDALDH